MNSLLSDNKKELRDIFREKLRTLSKEEQAKNSIEICQNLINLAFFLTYDEIVCYYPFGKEADILPFAKYCFSNAKKIYFPKFLNQENRYKLAEINDFAADFVLGNYGIFEPRDGIKTIESKNLEKSFWLIPALGFDESGNRLGRGAGYYDRLLKDVKNSFFVGIGFKSQLTEQIKNEQHDVKMQAFVSEAGVIKF